VFLFSEQIRFESGIYSFIPHILLVGHWPMLPNKQMQAIKGQFIAPPSHAALPSNIRRSARYQ
jgi:hypothetical protein